jgi:hypothetical protein
MAVAMMAAVPLADPAAADEAKIEHLGLELIGNLETASGELGSARAIVLIVPDALAVHSADGPRALQAGLVAHRIPSLAITLSLGMDARRKPFDCGFDHDHRDSDAAQEIAAWVQWLVAQGARAVVLVGEGRGALQVALEAPAQDAGTGPSADPATAVRGLVVIAPSPSDPPSRAADFRSRYGTDLGPVLAEAHRVGRESGEDSSIDVPGFLGCARARATAGAFLDAYDPERAPDLVRLVRKRGLPTLAFLPPDDPRRAAFSVATNPIAGGATLRIEMLSTDPGGPDILAQPGTAARVAAFISGLVR